MQDSMRTVGMRRRQHLSVGTDTVSMRNTRKCRRYYAGARCRMLSIRIDQKILVLKEILFNK